MAANPPPGPRYRSFDTTGRARPTADPRQVRSAIPADHAGGPPAEHGGGDAQQAFGSSPGPTVSPSPIDTTNNTGGAPPPPGAFQMGPAQPAQPEAVSFAQQLREHGVSCHEPPQNVSPMERSTAGDGPNPAAQPPSERFLPGNPVGEDTLQTPRAASDDHREERSSL